MTSDFNPLVPVPAQEYRPWKPFLIKGETWRKSTADLLRAGGDGFGRRELIVRHPESSAKNPSIAPGIQARFGVIPRGQSIRPHKSNDTHFLMIIRGAVKIRIEHEVFNLSARDFLTIPGMRGWTIESVGTEDVVYLDYSNRSLLERLGVFFEFPARLSERAPTPRDRSVPSAREVAGPGYSIDASGGHLLPYEHLVDPDFDESSPKVWRWERIREHLPSVAGLHKNYDGRPLWILYNTDTKARSGTTPCFFATIFSSMAGRVTPSHRHASAAVNFIIDGAGYSLIGGERVAWEAGDLMLSAPGWMEHSHCILEDNTNILTIQDHPLHISMESLVWQENLPDGPLINVGSQKGYDTNLQLAVS